MYNSRSTFVSVWLRTGKETKFYYINSVYYFTKRIMATLKEKFTDVVPGKIG